MTERRREQIRQYTKENYWRHKELGICTRCGKEDAIKGETLCWICKGNEKDRLALQYIERIRKKVCPQCNKRKPAPGRAFCNECHEKHKEAAKKLALARKERGECTRCGKELEQYSGFVTCPTCREKNRSRKKKAA